MHVHAFLSLITMSLSKFTFSSKIWCPHPQWWSPIITLEVKNRNVKIISNGVLKYARWENSKYVLKIKIEWHLTPFCPPKIVKNGLNRVFRQLSTVFFSQKRIKCYLVLFWGLFESSHHLASLGPHLIWFSHFCFLAYHVITWPQMRVGVPFFKELRWAHRNQH